MKKTIGLIIYLMFSLTFSMLISSCSSKKTSSSSVKLNLSALLASGSVSLNGGVLIMGRTLDDRESIKIGLANATQDYTMELPKGKWEFAVIGWGGSIPLNGVVRCGYSGVINIDKDAFDVNLSLNRGLCKGFNSSEESILFSDVNYLESDASGDINQFKKIDVRSCMAVNPAGGCTDPSGLTNSYRFIIEGEYKGSRGVNLLPGLVSGCFNSNDSITDSNGIRLPVGNSSEGFIDYKLLVYTSTDCSGDPLIFPFNERSVVMGLNGSSIKSSALYESSFSVIYVEHNPSTVNEFINNRASYFGFGRDGDLTSSSLAANYTIPLNDYAKVKAINSAGDQFTLQTASSNINVYDEVMWYVNGERAANACGTTPNKLVTGMFGHGYVKSKTVSSDTVITIDRGLNSYKLENGNIIALEIPTLGMLSSNCSIQIIKVREFRNIIYSSAPGIKIMPPKFNSANDTGGIIAMKVNGYIQQNAADQGFDATGTGLDFQPYFDNCYAVGKRCMGMGHTSLDSKRGGGIIHIQVQNLDISNPGDFYFSASGEFLPKWSQISISATHACALDLAGKAYCWGDNTYGQLGDGTNTNHVFPAPILGAGTYSKIKTSMNSTCALKTSGEVECWGDGSGGALGQGNTSNSSSPLLIGGLTSVVDIVAGRNFFCALKSNNFVYCWGDNGSGQFGTGNTTSSLIPVQSLATNVVKLFAGGYHTCVIDSTQNVKCAGGNSNGQLGDGSTSQRTTHVNVSGLIGALDMHLGDGFSCGIKGDQSVSCWGYGTNGQMGNNNTTMINSTPVVVSGLTNINKLYGGGNHVCAKDSSNTISCWGKNDNGAVSGTGVNVVLPRVVNLGDLNGQTIISLNSDASLTETSCALLSGGGMKCWGKNESGSGSLFGESTLVATYIDNPTWSGGSGLTKAGHVNLNIKNISSTISKNLKISNRDYSSNQTENDGPMHLRYCQKSLETYLILDNVAPISYPAIQNNLCF